MTGTITVDIGDDDMDPNDHVLVEGMSFCGRAVLDDPKSPRPRLKLFQPWVVSPKHISSIPTPRLDPTCCMNSDGGPRAADTSRLQDSDTDNPRYQDNTPVVQALADRRKVTMEEGAGVRMAGPGRSG